LNWVVIAGKKRRNREGRREGTEELCTVALREMGRCFGGRESNRRSRGARTESTGRFPVHGSLRNGGEGEDGGAGEKPPAPFFWLIGCVLKGRVMAEWI
jgi:hypothetical protein